MKIYKNIFNEIISLENLFSAWDSFKKGKSSKPGIIRFGHDIEKNIFSLHNDLKQGKYDHGPYTAFNISDPKPRNIHKATIRDRVFHHAVFNVLNPVFEKTFISNSFSCRINKGAHKGFGALEKMIGQESRNYRQPCFILKCDIRKFFATVNHDILFKIISRKIKDNNALKLIEIIINSFSSAESDRFNRKGLPLGNLTSQLFANIYLNELDRFVKNGLKIRRYARYTDDFVIISRDKNYLLAVMAKIKNYLLAKLKLELHPNKISIRKYCQGIDFLGYIALPHYCLLRTKTKKRIFKNLKQRIMEYKQEKISKKSVEQTLQSYLGVLSHASAYRLRQKLINQFWFWLNE
ncbi:MAG: reverse transcriptase domain-containing protein [Candidatus Komeilibacteria bacterium]|nr:reverse transcriptase domain-containing protein [Candidatus Komeilibacteria bacterium]